MCNNVNHNNNNKNSGAIKNGKKNNINNILPSNSENDLDHSLLTNST
jgi:hypothetical protein